MTSFNRLPALLKTPCVALALACALPAMADDPIDVQKLIAANGCLGCHSKDKKIVGPALHDVAAKYAGDPQAVATISDHIRSGGVGRWGQVPMPPMTSLTEAQAQALAAFVLKQ